MESYKLNTREMGYYQDIVDRHLVRILKLDGVFRFGVGYKMKNGEVSNEINLIALVNKKHANLPVSQRVPSEIDGVQTDVIGIESIAQQATATINMSTASILAGLIADRNKKFDPVTGGVPIRNRNIGVNNVGVLGAIVYDRQGNAYGLSAQHAIGDQSPNKRAQRGDPINQPLSFDKKDEIGTLHKFDIDLDAAMFAIDTKRNFEPKMQGNESENEEPFELNEATQARIGQIVECPARRTHTRGCVNYYLSHIKWIRRNGVLQPKKIRTVVIEFLKGFSETMAGDSGAVWVDSKSKCPVALHSGIKYIWLPNGRVMTVAVGSCMEQIAEWGQFRFSCPDIAGFKKEFEGYETDFVNQGSNLLAFCHAPGQAQKLLVKKIDSNLKLVSKQESEVFPKSAVAVAEFNNGIYASWRSASDKIQIAKLNSNTLELNRPSTFNLSTRRKPAMLEFNKRLVLAYIDAKTTRLNIAHCDKNWNWRQFEITNIQSTCAPAMAVFKNRIYICWSDANSTMKLAELNLSSNSRTINYYDTLNTKKTFEDCSLEVVDGKLCLAYTTLRNELRIVETTDLWQWTIRKKDDEQKSSPPTLVRFNEQLICVR